MTSGMSRRLELEDGTYVCADCGTRILTVTVAHPIWVEESGDSGFGECEYEKVLYCPNCEAEPDSHSKPVYVSLEDLG